MQCNSLRRIKCTEKIEKSPLGISWILGLKFEFQSDYNPTLNPTKKSAQNSFIEASNSKKYKDQGIAWLEYLEALSG